MPSFKKIFILFWAMSSLPVYGQEGIKKSVTIKKEKYYVAKGCSDVLQWEEVILRDKAAADKINAVLRKTVNKFKFKKEDKDLVCNNENNFSRSVAFKVVYLNNGVLSYHVFAETYYKGVIHDLFQFAALNFNTANGKQLHFKDIFDSSNSEALNALLKKKIEDETSVNECLAEEAYNIVDGGIEFLFWGGTFPNSVILSYKELQPFVHSKGPLKIIYSKIKT